MSIYSARQGLERFLRDFFQVKSIDIFLFFSITMYVVDNVCLFVCVEVLRPSQPNGVMLSMYVVGMKTCCRNSLESPLQGTSNAYHNLMKK